MDMLSERLLELVDAARSAARQAYNPYSNFAVGCAIRSKSGLIYRGCNVENASYSVTLCAERVAASQAILAGELLWESMVVLSPQRVSMCGTCRQFCHEFSPHVEVWTGFLDRNEDMFGPTPLWQLLPDGMRLEKFS